MNVIYGQIGTLTKLILPTSSSPKPTEGGAFFSQDATGVKSRHSSVSMVSPLNSVEEEKEAETVLPSNGVVKSKSVEIHSEPKLMNKLAESAQQQQQRYQQQAHQQQQPEQQEQRMQHSSSCTIS